MPGLARQLHWMIVIRLGFITIVGLPYGFLGEEGSYRRLAPILGLVLLTYLLCGLYFTLLRALPRRYDAQAYLQFIGDLALLSVLIWIFGVGVSNPLSLLYLPVIAVATTMLGRRAGFNLAIVAYGLYASLLLGLFYRVIPVAPGTVAPTPSLVLLGYNLVVHLFAFLAVASLTYVLVRRQERTQKVLEEEREGFADLQVAHRDIVESLHSGIITTDLAGTITTINRAGAEILDRSPEELRGKRTYETELLTHEGWRELRDFAGEPSDRRSRFEVAVKREEGTTHIGFSISPLKDAEGRQRGYIVVFQDLTRWRRLEEEVRIKDRMAAVGELAAGIAHEIGNPLASISGSVQMLSASFDQSHEGHKLLELLLKESQRLDRTIKGFLRFARPRERSSVDFDVAALLAENFELLRNSPEVSSGHRLEIDLDPPSLSLMADPDQVSQIFWNLARNALKAMPEGGLLKVGGRRRGEVYSIEVIDTGHGMSEKERANLFHPFQSFFDSGTGIGMAIVYRIVEEHRGRVYVTSRPGGGTRITVELPLAGVSLDDTAGVVRQTVP